MMSRIEENGKGRFERLEIIIVAAACVITAIFCIYVIYAAM